MRNMPLVLLAEHQPAVRRTLSLLLERSGYQVAETADGCRVAQLAFSHRPDLVLLDMQMPNIEGLAVLRQIRGLSQTARLPVIVLSASSRRDDVLAAAQAGASYYIAKGAFSTRDFLSRVAGFVGWGRSAGPSEPAAVDAAVAGQANPAPDRQHPPGLPPSRACFLRDATARAEICQRVPPIMPADLNAWASKITQVRALPFVMPRVLALTVSQYSSADSLVEAIQQDIALTGKVLAIANSTMYRRGRDPVTNLRQAVRNIGFGSVRQAAMGLSLMDLFSRADGDSGIDRLAFWEHSFASASISSLLAERAGMDSGQAFIVGLLHGLGRLIFDDFLPDEYAAMLAISAGDQAIPADLERRWMGVEHAHLAQLVLNAWHMPAELYEPIGDHRLPLAALLNKPDRRRWAGLVKLADCLATCLDFGDRRVQTLTHLENEFTDDFAIDEQFLNQIRDTIPAQLRELKMAMLLYLPKAGLTQRHVQTQARPVLYLCPRPPRLDVVEYYLRLRVSAVETVNKADAFIDKLANCAPGTLAVVNLLTAPLTDRTVSLMDQSVAERGDCAEAFHGLVLARPDQVEQLAGPFGRLFDGLLAPMPVDRLRLACTAAGNANS